MGPWPGLVLWIAPFQWPTTSSTVSFHKEWVEVESKKYILNTDLEQALIEDGKDAGPGGNNWKKRPTKETLIDCTIVALDFSSFQGLISLMCTYM